jgi:hypothetical protein
MSSLRPPISHTTVVAYLALFVALGGTTYAAATRTGRDIENGTITAPTPTTTRCAART